MWTISGPKEDYYLAELWDHVKDRSWIHESRLHLKNWWTPTITNKNSVKEKTNYDKWERPYRMCLMVIKHTIPITIRGSIPDKVSAKSFSAELADRFIKSDKVEANMHLNKLINIRYNGKKT